MATTDLVRTSRDGDQFHYLWAARQCLKLLPGKGDLVAVTIEGASKNEAEDESVSEGQEIIDVGFYYGSENLNEALNIRYVQLKHSTVVSTKPWTASGLKKTIEGFAARYLELRERFSEENIFERFRFEFTTNRPIDSKVQEALVALRCNGEANKCKEQQRTLLRYSNLNSAQATQFFKLFDAVGCENGLWEQNNLLTQDLSGYLVEADYDSPVQLKDLITRKATTEFESNPSIRRHDVLRALKVSEEILIPAPCLISTPENTIDRDQEHEIIQELLDTNIPLIIHADAGVGKSTIASRIAAAMPDKIEVVLYDCFGDGLYRSSLNFRHRHRDGLVQIANELAAKGLCHPLIPSSNADSKQYMRAFLHRITQAITILKAKDQEASLCIIVDAADNAEMAAEEQREAASFVQDLIRTKCPEGVKLAFTCRTHRRPKLGLQMEVREVELQPFSLSESALHLRNSFPHASDAEVEEFHFLSSFNPRVQALALEREVSLQEMLKGLGPEPTTVERAIGNLLEKTVLKLKRNAGTSEALQIEMMCKGLAVLRPLIPVSVLSKLSQTSESAIRSFALDFGRPLLMKGNSLHFLDEPTETWFRESFKPSRTDMIDFVERLQLLADKSSYVASALPLLMLEAGKLNELITLSLSGEGLPNDSPLERREVELQRLTFSIQACLQEKQYLAAAKLAFKAGGECAGEERQNALIQSNTDLAAKLLSPDRIEEIVSRKTFNAGWMGSHHAYDAGLLSGRKEFFADASSRLRMAIDWLHNWARSEQDEHYSECVLNEDIVELSSAILRLRGAEATARFLRSWSPRKLAFEAGHSIGKRLIDLGEYDKLDALIEASGNDVWLLLGLISEVSNVSHKVPEAPLRRLLRLLRYRRIKLSEPSERNSQWEFLNSIRSMVEVALRTLPKEPEKWAFLIKRYLPVQPPSELTNRYGMGGRSLLKSYALMSCLQGKPLELVDIAPEAIREQMESKNNHWRSQELQAFKRNIGGALPWVNLSYEIACGRPPQNLGKAIEEALDTTNTVETIYSNDLSLTQTIVLEWAKILLSENCPDHLLFEKLKAWIEEKKKDIWPKTYTSLCRMSARAIGGESLSLDFFVSAVERLESFREHAESRAESYLELARAIYTVNPDESSVYFNRSIEIASRIGEENTDRWSALLHLAKAAGEPDNPRPKTAYRLSRIAELTYEYVARDKHFDWNRTAESLTGLCASSALAILSRWRDRRFGNSGRLFPLVIYQLCDQDLLPKYAPVSLSGMDAQWDRLQDLKRVMAENDTVNSKVAPQIAYRYMRLRQPNGDELQELKELGKVADINFEDLERLVASESENTYDDTEKNKEIIATNSRNNSAPDWDELFKDVDLSCPDALLSAYNLGLQCGSFSYSDLFFREAFARVRVGRESRLVRAVCAWPNFDIFMVRSLLEAFPCICLKQESFKRAIKDAVLEACRREPQRVSRRGWGALLPFERLNEEGLVSDEDVVMATIDGFEAQVKNIGAGGFFKLIDSLAATLIPNEAEEVVNFGFDLLDELLEPEDGDGPWIDDLMPPTSLISSLAGYIWAGLGSPVASERWEHAHIVRAVVELNWTEVLDELVSWAYTERAFPFVDQSLDFYLWHARQWLLIGLARGGLENSSALRPIVPFLRQMVNVEHVLIRDLAAQTLRALAISGELSHKETLSFSKVNHPHLTERLYSGWFGDDIEEESDCEDISGEDEKYYFGIDVGPYWFAPLGLAFGVSQGAVERRARSVLSTHLGWKEKSGYKEDARYQKNIFDGRETSHSHGSMPQTDDLTAYQCFHAMMIVAADLLVERPVRRNEDETANEFQQWFESYQSTRKDGKWLFDRRDPLIDKKWSTAASGESQFWKWSISPKYLDQKLVTVDACTNLWGDWTNYDNGYKETTTIRSALVSRAGAMSLVSALQTSSQLDPYALPSAARQGSLSTDEFSLRGWILDDNVCSHIDEFDPWATNLKYPGPVPSEEITCLKLSTDGRFWYIGKNGFIRSETWIEPQGYGREEESVPGTRLSCNSDFITEFFNNYPDDCLVISVAVRRSVPKYLEIGKDYLSYVQPYVRFYLMERDGAIRTL